MRQECVLITGASTGIGYELAKLFAADNASLVLVARSVDTLKKVAEELKQKHGVAVRCLARDLSDPNSPREIIEQLRANQMRVDVLVNNAGFGSLGAFVESNLSTELEMIQVNITSLVTLTRMLLPDMVARRRGGIINVASTAAFQAGPYMATYYASKAFVLSFSEALAEEVRDQGVKVTALCPGPTVSEFANRAGVSHTKLFNSKLVKIMSAGAVAKLGFVGFKKGRRVVVTGLNNRLSVLGTRLVTRKFSARIAGRINRAKT